MPLRLPPGRGRLHSALTTLTIGPLVVTAITPATVVGAPAAPRTVAAPTATSDTSTPTSDTPTPTPAAPGTPPAGGAAPAASAAYRMERLPLPPHVSGCRPLDLSTDRTVVAQCSGGPLVSRQGRTLPLSDRDGDVTVDDIDPKRVNDTGTVVGVARRTDGESGRKVSTFARWDKDGRMTLLGLSTDEPSPGPTATLGPRAATGADHESPRLQREYALVHDLNEHGDALLGWSPVNIRRVDARVWKADGTLFYPPSLGNTDCVVWAESISESGMFAGHCRTLREDLETPMLGDLALGQRTLTPLAPGLDGHAVISRNARWVVGTSAPLSSSKPTAPPKPRPKPRPDTYRPGDLSRRDAETSDEPTKRLPVRYHHDKAATVLPPVAGKATWKPLAVHDDGSVLAARGIVSAAGTVTVFGADTVSGLPAGGTVEAVCFAPDGVVAATLTNSGTVEPVMLVPTAPVAPARRPETEPGARRPRPGPWT